MIRIGSRIRDVIRLLSESSPNGTVESEQREKGRKSKLLGDCFDGPWEQW